MQGVRPGRERVRIGVVHDPDAGTGDAGGDRHLFHHVDELPLIVALGFDDLPGPGRPQHLLGPRAVPVPGDRRGREREGDAEPGKGVVIRVARRVAAEEVIDVVAAEPEPREERHEGNHEHDGAPAIGFLLLKEVQRRCVAHVFGLRERSTCGTAFSPWSSISRKSAGCALARPATRLVGNCCCLVLYWGAVSLFSCPGKAPLVLARLSSSCSLPTFPVARGCGYCSTTTISRRSADDSAFSAWLICLMPSGPVALTLTA